LHLLALSLSGAVILVDSFTNSLDYSGCHSLTVTACFHLCFPEIFETNGETVLIHDDQIIFRLSTKYVLAGVHGRFLYPFANYY